jgi:hypothetical protein
MRISLLPIPPPFKEMVVVKTGEVCDFKNGRAIKKDALVEDVYLVIGDGKKPRGFHNEYN